jgi:Fe-S-cluster containining protein
MPDLEFHCLRCGTCCRNLFNDKAGLKKGVTLTKSEKNLFPEKMVSPHMAVGMEKPDTIILYQLNVNDCPFIDQSNKCLIYPNRPLMCQAFPIVNFTYSGKCKFFNFSKFSAKITIDWGEGNQVEAFGKLDRYIINHFKRNFKKGIGVWSFDLATNKWVLKNRYKTFEGRISF